MITNILTNPRAVATILAALRYWQRHGAGTACAEQIIASDGDTLKPMDAQEIDTLCEAINCAESGATQSIQPYPNRIVVHLDGGIVQNIYADRPLQYLIYDFDLDGVSEDDVAMRPSMDSEDVTVEVYQSGCIEADIVPSSRIAHAFASLEDETAAVCNKCEAQTQQVIGCPNGAEICVNCFTTAEH